MRLLLTAFIGLAISAAAFAGGPDARMIPFRSENGQPCTAVFETRGDGFIHVTLVSGRKEIAITFEDLFPEIDKVRLSKEQGDTLRSIVESETKGLNYYLGSLDPITNQAIYCRIDYRKNLK